MFEKKKKTTKKEKEKKLMKNRKRKKGLKPDIRPINGFYGLSSRIASHSEEIPLL